jgi:effector-binding domain-containing protein
MNRARFPHLALMTLVPAAAMALLLNPGFINLSLIDLSLISPSLISPSLAQSPSSSAPAAPPAAATTTPTPATSAPAPPAVATPASPPAAQSPASPPAAAQTSPATPEQKAQAADPFGEEMTLTPKMIVALKGKADWDSAFESLVGSLKTLSGFLDKQNIKPSGPMMIVYITADDNGFTYQAEIPVDQEPKNAPKEIAVGKSPDGKVLKFVHRGSYDNMDNTYEAITNHLDDRKLEAKDTFVEEYITDPLKTAEDKLVINVFVPLK